MGLEVFSPGQRNNWNYGEQYNDYGIKNGDVKGTFADTICKADAVGKKFSTEADGSTKKTARQYREQVFDQIAPNAPQRVKQAWLDAADVAGVDGMGVSNSGKLSHISQLMIRSIEKGYRGNGVCDLLGNSVQSAMRAADEALYALEHPLDAGRGRTAEQIENRRKEKIFYQEFMKRLQKVSP